MPVSIVNLISKYRVECIIVSIAIVLRLIFFFLMMGDLGPDHLIDQFQDPVKYVKASEYMFGVSDMGQIELYLVGPGYPVMLGLFRIVIGETYWPVVLFQIFLSAIASVLIYRLGIYLTANRHISIIAGILSAVSITSISLANTISSDTLFFCLLVISVTLFFASLNEKKWILAVLSGIIGGLSILVRSAAIFYPAIFILSAMLIPGSMLVVQRKKALFRSIVVSLIMLLLPAMWGVYNYNKHNTFTVSATGLLAAKTYLAAKVTVEGEKRHFRNVVKVRDSLYQAALDDFEKNKYKHRQQESIRYISDAFKNYPGLFIKQYFRVVLYNVTAVSSLQYLLLPSHESIFRFVDDNVHRGYDNPFVLVLSLVGFAVYWRRNRRVAVILLLNILYFGFISGVSFGQGSRIFYPAIITQAMLAAIAVLFLYDICLIPIKKSLSPFE